VEGRRGCWRATPDDGGRIEYERMHQSHEPRPTKGECCSLFAPLGTSHDFTLRRSSDPGIHTDRLQRTYGISCFCMQA
jgi:hypothetical protein